MSREYDVIIVGAGPAGIFAALELSQHGKLSIAILEKGPDIDKRVCAARLPGGRCIHCQTCFLLSGWGGAGAFSDGKLTLSPAVGGHLPEIVSQERTAELIEQVDGVYIGFGASGPVHGTRTDVIERVEKRCALAGLRLLSVPIRHLGTERSADILRAMRTELTRRGVHIADRTEVKDIRACPISRQTVPKCLASGLARTGCPDPRDHIPSLNEPKMAFIIRTACLRVVKRMPVDKARGYIGPVMVKAEACTECGTCLPRCPYNLEIPALLIENREKWGLFEKTGVWPD